MGFSIIFTIHFGVPLFLETPIWFSRERRTKGSTLKTFTTGTTDVSEIRANHQLRLVVFPHYLFKVLYIPTVVGLGNSEPSTVSSKTLVGRVSWTTFVSGWVSKSKSDTHPEVILREFSPEGHQKKQKEAKDHLPSISRFSGGFCC